MSAQRTPGPFHIGEIDGRVAIYHRTQDPFAKFGTRRVVDCWCGSESLARALLPEIEAEARAALAKAGAT